MIFWSKSLAIGLHHGLSCETGSVDSVDFPWALKAVQGSWNPVSQSARPQIHGVNFEVVHVNQLDVETVLE